MKILVSNIGSTSLKYRLFEVGGGGAETLLAKGGLERVTDYGRAIDACLGDLRERGVLRDAGELAAVGFKPVIAKNVSGCVLMDEGVLGAMEEYSGIAPSHNPPYIDGIRRFQQRMPETPMVGLFETAFYQWLPAAATRYAIPQEWHDLGVRRWGFHGASHKYIAERSAELLGRPDVAERVRRLYVDSVATPVAGPSLRVISCHLGGSSSITAIRDGIAIGHSFGMTPQSGLPHNNRVGDLDSMAVPYLLRSGLALEEIERQMAKEGGLKGISGVSNDMRDIHAQAAAGNPRAQLAIDVLAAEIRRWIGSLVLELNGLDALVFTGGIGENDAVLRRAVCRNLDFIGLRLNENSAPSRESDHALLSEPDSRVRVYTIETNEELVIAREVKRWLENR